MSTLKVDNLQSGSREYLIPLKELSHRFIQQYRDVYIFGSWTPSTSYTWMPGAYVDFTPQETTSRIRFTLCLTMGHVNGHAISHNIFYANGVEIGRHSISGQSPEHRHTYVWDVPSWGTTPGRIGYQTRNYGTSNQALFHGTYYWDGVGSNQTAQTEILVEEYLPLVPY
jgi:hypothetical protein